VLTIGAWGEAVTVCEMTAVEVLTLASMVGLAVAVTRTVAVLKLGELRDSEAVIVATAVDVLMLAAAGWPTVSV